MVNRILNFFADFCSGVCRNLSTDVFIDTALENFMEISNFSTEDQKRSQPVSTHRPLPSCLETPFELHSCSNKANM